MLTYFGLAGIFLLLLLNAAEVSERSVVTPEEFEIAFPKVMGWIQKTLLAHQRLALPVTSKNFQRLPLYFSPAQIDAAKYVVVDRIPVPPLSSIGLSRFAEFERGDYGGIFAGLTHHTEVEDLTQPSKRYLRLSAFSMDGHHDMSFAPAGYGNRSVDGIS